MPLVHTGGKNVRSPYNEWILFGSVVYHVSKFEPIKIQTVISTVAINAVNLRSYPIMQV
jgi:hypothetical protein